MKKNQILARIIHDAAQAAPTLSVGRRCCAAQMLGRRGTSALPNYEISGLVASLMAGATVIFLGFTASASVETFAADYGSSSHPLPLGGPDFPATLTLPKFDTSLGNLTDIEIILTTDGLLRADIINFGGMADFLNAQAKETVTAAAPGGAESIVSLATMPFSGSIAAGSSAQGPLVLLAGTDISHAAPADFSAYEYNGVGGGVGSTLDVNLLGAASYVGTGALGLFFGGDASAYGSVEIEYNYSAVPETGRLWADLGILACGFAAFSQARRARFCNAS